MEKAQIVISSLTVASADQEAMQQLHNFAGLLSVVCEISLLETNFNLIMWEYLGVAYFCSMEIS